MAKKQLKFYVHQLVIEGIDMFDCSTFNIIKNSDTETFEMKKIKDDKVEILSVKKILKNIYENRFIGISFDMGDKYPYSPKVVNEDLCEQDNPRKADLIELDEQLFVLIDVQTQRMWISDQRKKGDLRIWLKDKLDKATIVKSIINDKEFIDKIKSVKEISFSIAPNLFNSSRQDTLSSHLIDDILGFGAEKAKLSLEFNNSKISDKIKSKLRSLIGKKDEFNDITVIGRSDENLDSTFNLNEITSRVQIDIPTNQASELLNPNEVFLTLINKIK